jgi:hypothetical protein
MPEAVSKKASGIVFCAFGNPVRVLPDDTSPLVFCSHGLETF